MTNEFWVSIIISVASLPNSPTGGNFLFPLRGENEISISSRWQEQLESSPNVYE